jgi:hypothetical protein
LADQKNEDNKERRKIEKRHETHTLALMIFSRLSVSWRQTKFSFYWSHCFLLLLLLLLSLSFLPYVMKNFVFGSFLRVSSCFFCPLLSAANFCFPGFFFSLKTAFAVAYSFFFFSLKTAFAVSWLFCGFVVACVGFFFCFLFVF